MSTNLFIQHEWIELGDKDLNNLFIHKHDFETKERAFLYSTIIEGKLPKINNSVKINPRTNYFIILIRHHGGDIPNKKDKDAEYLLSLHLGRPIDAIDNSYIVCAFQTKEVYENTLNFIRENKLFRGVTFARKKAVKAA